MNSTLVVKSSSANARLISVLIDSKIPFNSVVVCGLNRITINEVNLNIVLQGLGHFESYYSNISKNKWKIIVY